MKTVAIIGLGNRGGVYAKNMAKNEKVKIVSVCDVKQSELDRAHDVYGVAKENLFLDENEFFKEKRADILFITTMDEMHFRQTVKALDLGYDIVLEKPVSPVYEECKAIAEHAKKTGRKVVICHNLRYTPFYQRFKKIISEGLIGEVVSMEQAENVGYAHYMSSFIRGKWHNEAESSPILLQKTCHDMDIIYWLLGKKCEQLSSVGKLAYYTEACAPKESTPRCKDCPIQGCWHDARVHYTTWPGELQMPYGTPEDKETVLKYLDGVDYGKCVYHMNNDVCDRQTVNLQFEDGVTANLLLHAFANGTHRITKVYGTEGMISGRLESGIVTLERYDGTKTVYDVNKEILDKSGHLGGDSKLVLDVVDYFVDGTPALGLSFVDDSIYSHKLVFEAEKSRKTGEWVNPGRTI